MPGKIGQLVADLRAIRSLYSFFHPSNWRVDRNDHSEKVADPKFDGTVKRGSATCSCRGYTTPATQMRSQLKARRGGTKDARLICVVTTRDDASGRFYRFPAKADFTVL